MRNSFGFLSLLFCCFLPSPSCSQSPQRSTPSSPDYVAAVVEFASEASPDYTPLQQISRNWAGYERYIALAREKSSDIIVFPEVALTPGLPHSRDALRPYLAQVPDPETRPNLCDQPVPSAAADQVLRNVSCAARQYEIYVVLNLAAEAPCSGQDDCPEDGFFIYNTNVAFDRNGVLIVRYHKFHLFSEPGFNTPPEPELAYFDTDFGVRFGTFICFDILFGAPATRLVREANVTDIAYPHAWFSELPFLTAVETHSGWAHALNVTVLAAGLDRPHLSNTGSGIYWGTSGPLAATMHTERGSAILTARVPKRSAQRARADPARTPAPIANPIAAAVSSAAAAVAADTARTGNSENKLPLPILPIETSKIGHLTLWQDDFRPYSTVLIRPGKFQTVLCYEGFCCAIDSESEARNGTATNEVAAPYHYRFGVFNGVRNMGGMLAAGVQVCGVFSCLDPHSLASCGMADEGRAGLGFSRIEVCAFGLRRENTLLIPTTVVAETLLPLNASLWRFEPAVSDDTYARLALDGDGPINSTLLGFGIYNRVFDRDHSLPE